MGGKEWCQVAFMRQFAPASEADRINATSAGRINATSASIDTFNRRCMRGCEGEQAARMNADGIGRDESKRVDRTDLMTFL